MIYAKIYVEKDSDGTEVLVFDSVRQDEECYIRLAGKKQGKNGTLVVLCTAIFDYKAVAISPEARELFRSMLNALPPSDKVRFPADFEFRSSGYFSFRPDAVKAALLRKSNFPDAGKCDTSRRLRPKDRFCLTVGEGSFRQGLDEMTEIDNDTLARLDLSTPQAPKK